MTTTSIRERYALDIYEPIWRKKGYTVIRQPSADQLPDFLKGLRPDAIATGPQPSMVIEVATGERPAKLSRMQRLSSALAGKNGWEFSVIWVGSDDGPVKPASLEAIASALRSASTLIESEPEAALLLAWAAIEAVGRWLEPQLAEFTLGALALVDLLVAYGHITQEEGDTLAALAKKRNRLAHGELEISPSANEIRTVIGMAEALLRTAPRDVEEKELAHTAS